MFDALARALFGGATLAPAFANASTNAGVAPRAAKTAAPLRLVQAATVRTGGERPESEALDTPLAWADFPRGF